MVDVTIPKVGLTVESVEVLEWHAAAGDPVTAGQPLVDVSADKADLAIEAPADGVLAEIVLDTGETGAPGEVLGRIGGDPGPGDTEAAPREPVLASAAVAASAASDAGPAGMHAPEPLAAATVMPTRANGGTPGVDGRQRVSPVARRVAAQLGVDLAAVSGSGPRGRVVRGDVLRASEAASPAAPAPAPDPPPPATADDLTPVRWTAARRATMRRMAESAAAVAPVTLHRRAPAELAARAIRRLKADGVPATFNHAVLAAVAGALPGHPALNAVWDGETLLRSARVHLGIAVDVGGDLMVAVVADADRADVVGLCSDAAASVARTRRREPQPGPSATFSVSNLGMLGVEQFTPIITLPQVAVLGVGAVVDGRCHLSLTFDHRAVDGAPAARFLADLTDRLAAFDGR